MGADTFVASQVAESGVGQVILDRRKLQFQGW